MKKENLKGVVAVLAGFVSVVALSSLTDTLLEKIGIFPKISVEIFSVWMLVLAFLYRSVYAVIGGYITAKLSPDKSMKYVKILGIIGTIAGFIGVIAGWKFSSHWYPILLALTAFPLTQNGGRRYFKKVSTE